MKKNNLSYFKHWLPNTLIQYWEKKKINPDFAEPNGLIIYEKKNNKIWGKTLTAKNKKLPFGEAKYNDEHLETVVFRGAEHPIGPIFKNLYDNGGNYEFSGKDKIQILYFWLILILRNKFTIHNFSICLENLLKQYVAKHKSLKHNLRDMEIEYLKYETKGNIEEFNVDTINIKNEEELMAFFDSEKFIQFAKDIYWKFSKDVLTHNKSVLKTEIIKEKTILQDILYYIDKEFTYVPIYEDEYLMLSDYPCFTFSIQNNLLVPINFDANFFNDKYMDIINNDEINNKKTFSIGSMLNFDLFFIPVSPNYVIFFHKKELNINIINNHILNFFQKNKLSENRIEKFNRLGCWDKLAEFYFAMTIAQSVEHIIIPKENFADKIFAFLTEETLFLEKLDALKKIKIVDYFASLDKKQVSFSNYNPNSYEKYSVLKTEWFNVKSEFFRKISKKKAKKHIENNPKVQYIQQLMKDGIHKELEDYLFTKISEGFLIEKKINKHQS